MKVVLDTNVIVSGLGWKGKSQKILIHCLDGRFKLVTSPEIIKEIKAVIFRPKFDFITEDKKNDLINTLFEISEIVSPDKKIKLSRDPEDDKFIEAAITAKASFIVSGDPHLKEIKSYKSIKIVTPAEFLEILENE